MRFDGKELLGVLCNQVQPVLVCDAAGATLLVIENPQRDGIFDDQTMKGFFGIGNGRRIRYVQAKNQTVGSGWRGGSHTVRAVRADGSCSTPAGQLITPSRIRREHVPSPGEARRPAFSFCPPIAAEVAVEMGETRSRLPLVPPLAQKWRGWSK